ncbi:hypothetical protein Taro_012786 [Colocasia esculenta]|uniref:Uncharacterized protein n=1 Tax=Colocasia esculenta TaxID=4460 RepID=A0A843UDS9_COLES|nr:hypothetical protein [Colocasia esculenta]
MAWCWCVRAVHGGSRSRVVRPSELAIWVCAEVAIRSYEDLQRGFAEISCIHMNRCIISTYHIISYHINISYYIVSYRMKAHSHEFCVFVVLCQAPKVHTLAVNKYVGEILPRTRQGPYCTAIGQMDRSPKFFRRNIFISWPQNFNNKLNGVTHTTPSNPGLPST